MIDPQRTVLWSAASVTSNNASITLSDSIYNYDEVVYYGSATRSPNRTVAVKTEYPVLPGINAGGPFYCGRWSYSDTYILTNGTQVFLSGNSGYVHSSFFWGKSNGNTAFTGALRVNNYSGDIRPYKIVGVKYTTADDRTLLWSATGNPYNKSITLSESITGFKEIMVYGSGAENTNGTHLSKQVYPTQSVTIGCEPWCYTPWTTEYRCNYVLGTDFRLSGNSGYVGSAWFMGLNRTNTAWAAGKWTGDNTPKMMIPYQIYGLNRK